jgi:putative addiction module component (TIGR02574 family)
LWRERHRGIRKLPIPERLQLVGEIWDSILDDPGLLPVSDQLKRELELRLAAHRANPESSLAWELDREIFGRSEAQNPDPKLSRG